MRIHVITIGTEILTGHTTNTNLAFVGDQLSAQGYQVAKEVCVADTPAAIRRAVRQALREADLVITMGGLGPTRDDITRDVVAEVLAKPLKLDRDTLENIQRYVGRRGIAVDASVLETQAMVPEGATALRNDNGTAPGLWCSTGDKVVVLLPGPPRELQPMFARQVLPRIRQRAAPDTVRTMVRTCGVPESVAAAKLDTFMADYPDIDVAYCARPAEVDIRLSAATNHAEILEQAEQRIRNEFGEAALQADEMDVVDGIGRLLSNLGWRVATAESCTGGGIGATITERPGASEYFAGAVVCYSNDWKRRFLKVSDAALEQYGAVSRQVACEMVQGLLAVAGTEAGIAVTGIAGPGGGTPEKPVGLVFVATAVQDCVRVERFVFPGSRANVRRRTTAMALNQLRLHLLQAAPAGVMGQAPK